MSCLDALIALIVRCLLGRTALVPVPVRNPLAAEYSKSSRRAVAAAPGGSGLSRLLREFVLSWAGGARARGGGWLLRYGLPVRRF